MVHALNEAFFQRINMLDHAVQKNLAGEIAHDLMYADDDDRPSCRVRKLTGSTWGSIMPHCRVQYARTPSWPWTVPPSMPLGHSTSGVIVDNAPSMSRALNAA